MFETSPNNGWLVKEFARAAPRRLANSLAYNIYKLLPNDTDLTVFKEAGLPGLNFAFIDGKIYYHSPIDDAQRIDQRSLQHQGSYMLSLARHFSNLDLNRSNAGGGDAVYFNFLGASFIQYPAPWRLPLAAMVSLVFIAVVMIGFRRRLLTFSGACLGSLAFLLILIVAPAAVFLVWRVILFLHGEYAQIPQGDIYNGRLYLLSFVTLTVATASTIYNLFRKKAGFHNLAVGALSWWLIFVVRMFNGRRWRDLDQEDTTIYRVVVYYGEQYSIQG